MRPRLKKKQTLQHPLLHTLAGLRGTLKLRPHPPRTRPSQPSRTVGCDPGTCCPFGHCGPLTSQRPTLSQTCNPGSVGAIPDPFGTLDPFGSGSFNSAEGFADFSQMSKVRLSPRILTPHPAA
jgi:hypothetical protein